MADSTLSIVTVREDGSVTGVNWIFRDHSAKDLEQMTRYFTSLYGAPVTAEAPKEAAEVIRNLPITVSVPE